MVRQIHLWLGMISGAIVLVIALTGCIYVFQDELQDLTRNWRILPAENRSFAGPAEILRKLHDEFPDAKASFVMYQGKNRPASVNIDIASVPHTVYFNPYSGQVTHIQDMDGDFFAIVERLHRFLLLPQEIGKQVTGVATIIFVLMLVTGLVLWWPGKWKNSAQNFKIKWKARWRRVNYDWHRATGFHLMFPALLVAVTGLSFSYEWMHDALYPIGNLFESGDAKREVPEFVFDTTSASDKAMDAAFRQTRQLAPDSGMLFVWDQGEGLPILTGAYPNAHEFDHQSNFYFHPENGELLYSQVYGDKSAGTRLQEMNYGLHTGQYFGLFGKIMAFFASLFVAALPVTGFFVWWGRRKKLRKGSKNGLKVR